MSFFNVGGAAAMNRRAVHTTVAKPAVHAVKKPVIAHAAHDEAEFVRF
ncbi:MAG TPA: hypothetical protein VFW53_00225 [Gallionella sp.]|nr:hypothetical protein [Gallionella sp.]